MPNFRRVHHMRIAGLPRKILRRQCFRHRGRSPPKLPRRVGDPAQPEGQQHPGRHATHAPPAVDFLLRGRGVLRRGQQASRNRFTENVLMQAAQGIALPLPLQCGGLRLGVARQAYLKGRQFCG